MRVAVRHGAARVAHAARIDIVQPGEERDVHIGDAQARAVARRDRQRGAGERILQPHAVLEQ